MAADRPTLELQDVTKVYTVGDTDVHALREVSLSVQERELVVIMGPSGAGKTTFLTIAGALRRPTSGRVVVAGIEVTALSEHELPQVRRDKIGFIFQSFNLLEALSALQNVELVMETRGITGRAARAKASELLAIMGVSDRQGHVPKELSGGQKQRVAIARALANNPDLLLADEPTANLDARRGEEIIQLLRLIARELGKTVVAVTHDLRTRHLADRVLWLEDGEIRDISDEPGARGVDE